MGTAGGPAITRRAKRLLEGVPVVGTFFSSQLGGRLRKRLYQFRAAEVERIGTALDRAGAVWFIAGGWGVDALVGRQTRHHGDLDLCVEVAAGGEAKAIEALAAVGYEVTVPRAPSGHQFPFRAVLRDRSGRTVDLILVTCLDTSPTDEMVPVLGRDDCATGHIVVDGAPVRVPCLSAALQMALHCGYIPQARDRRDVSVLAETFGLDVPSIYRREPPPSSVNNRIHDVAWEVIARIRGISAVAVVVPEADELLSAVGGSVSGGMPAHVTVTYPFLSPRRIQQSHRDQLRAIASASESFDLELATLRNHELITFLTVTPEEPVRTLTAAVLEDWPDHPPYGDSEVDVPPHMTLGINVLPEEIADTVEPFLPIGCKIDRLVLMVRGLSGRWRIAEEYPLGMESARESDDRD
ncbi:MAG: 2'-5' RNA ligase family protein [Acidimicrobiales bacterium]